MVTVDAAMRAATYGYVARRHNMSQPNMQRSTLQEIESTFRAGSTEKRMETLMRVTDLFVNGAPGYSDDATHLFDDVIGRLIDHVEARARVELSRRLAPIANAPIEAVRRLARDDSIEVSGPVLAASERLTDEDLVEIVQTKSQAHLAKIANRARLNEAVTEALVDHGDDAVADKVARNCGARFSEVGMSKLVIRAGGNARLTESISQRPDIPRPLFRQLMTQATQTVRERLLALAPPEQRETITAVMDALASQVQRKPRGARNFAEAQRLIAPLIQDTGLVRSKIMEFADANRNAEVITALSVLSGIAVKEVDELFSRCNELGLTVLCKATGLECDAAYSVVAAACGESGSSETPSLEDFRAQYKPLSIASAQRILRFWQDRSKIAQNFEVGHA
jgi:uncharacterized protein (DUF2336 family)